ncbi:ARID1_AT-rich interaction domain protein [Hexamita inflata]|uniref:ARID1 AT-rich interaction domain protein n=1 Tax=Hexamita inflata TaxID=28002 RepID=A0AA86RED1_9EUKA|nr:ARID1 AT-rich interaction domain protein [Hexamita inflata]
MTDQPRFVSYPDGNMSMSYEIPPPEAMDSFNQQYSFKSPVQTFQVPNSNPSGISQVFMQRISELGRSMNRDMRRIPRVGRKDLDLYKLYELVQTRGGYTNITQWKDLADELDLPQSVTNAGYILRTKYESFILPFEKQLLQQFPIVCEDKQNWIQSHAESQKQQFQYHSQQIQQVIQTQLRNQINNLPNNNNASNSIKPKKASSLKKLKLDSLNPTDEQFQKLLMTYPQLESLELGSMTKITKVPFSFPITLKRLILKNLPEKLVEKFMEVLSQIDLEELELGVGTPQVQVPGIYESLD